ncbi:MAG: ATP-binding protein [Clostridia bacterium]|nr:ATP-binding protein [Clostridia bacterium]
MRARYASVAALIVLVFATILILINAVASVQSANRMSTQALASACRLSASVLDSAANSGVDELEALASYAELDQYDFCLFDGDGKIRYTNCVTDVALDEVDASHIASGGLQLYRNYHNDTVDMYSYAVMTLANGDLLRLAEPCYSLGNWMLEHILVNLLLTMVAMLVTYVVVYTLLNRQHRMISRIIGVLEDFSEGHYSSRIEGVEGDSVAQTEQFNAAVSRLEEHVFRQGTRNRALNNVMNQMKSGMLVVDSHMKVVLLSAVGKQLLGITGNAEGQYIATASKDVPLEKAFSEAMGQDGVYTCEVAARTETGRAHKPLRLYISSMMQDGKVVGMLALVEDISELRRLEQVRTDFAANVSHELKTPLTSIRGFVETLDAGAIDNPQMARKFLRIIMLETERLTRLINDILSISKLESGSDEVETERIRIDKMAEDICDMLSIHASEKQVKLHCHRNQEPVYIIGNHDRTEQMLINLIENGIKYNKPGGSVSVKMFTNEQKTECYISISDTGIGIAEEHLPRLFERFYRVDKGRSRSMGGTGLGLAIVKHIVRTMNGTIEVHSKLDEGTEFLITLPLAAAGDKGTMGDKLDDDEFDDMN